VQALSQHEIFIGRALLQAVGAAWGCVSYHSRSSIGVRLPPAFHPRAGIYELRVKNTGSFRRL